MEALRQSYPDAPGYKTASPETSKAAAAAETSRAAILRMRVVTALHQHGPCTADEAAELLGESILSVRPRMSELRKCDPPVVEDAGERRKNLSGHSACVWRLVERRTQPELKLL